MVAVNIDQLRSSESHEPGDADSRETRRIPANGLAPSARDQHERISGIRPSFARIRDQNVVGLRHCTKTESHELGDADSKCRVPSAVHETANLTQSEAPGPWSTGGF